MFLLVKHETEPLKTFKKVYNITNTHTTKTKELVRGGIPKGTGSLSVTGCIVTTSPFSVTSGRRK